MYHPVRPGSKDEHVTIFYRGSTSYQSLWIDLRSEANRAKLEQLEWDDFESNGRKLQISEPEAEDGLRVLALVQNGTRVQIASDLPKNEMVKIALSMATLADSK